MNKVHDLDAGLDRIEKSERLKHILGVPSYFLQEHQMIETIFQKLKHIPGVSYHHDQYGNIFAVKGEANHYPLICCHTDTVHRIEEYNVIEFKHSGSLEAYKAKTPNNQPSGIGGDNKTGIFICLELLRTQEVVKAAFFVGEENGCYGSTFADPDFFQDVAYCLSFDAPSYEWLTKRCNGEIMFDERSEFWKIAKPIIEAQTKGVRDPYNNTHPYTDVFPLKLFYDFPCLNYGSGYIRMHTVHEVVVLDYVLKCLETAKELLSALGTTKHTFEIGCPYTRQHLQLILRHRLEEMGLDYEKDFVKYPNAFDKVA